MRYDNENILDKVYDSKISGEEINELFRYLIGRDRWRDYIKYEKGERKKKGERNGRTTN